MYASPTLRTRAELVAAHQQARNDLAADQASATLARFVPHSEGILATLGWVLGDTDRAPLTTAVGVNVTDPEQVERERRVASRMLHGEEPMHYRGRMYVSGVETALMWAAGLADGPL